MKRSSPTYRFLSAITALVMLLSISTPAILHAGSFTDCDMDPAEHAELPVSDVMEDDHCNKAAHNEANEGDTDAEVDPENETCRWSFNCSCKIDEAAIPANAIPTLSKITAGFTQTVIQTISFSPETKLVNSSEQVFVSLYSPPLFLKNSSFLN